MTAAHLPVMPEATLEGWFVRADGLYIDGTFGRGGHSELLLQKLDQQGRLLAVDRDPEALQAAQGLQQRYPQLACVHGEIAGLAQIARERGWYGRVSGILLDLGVSSPQLDDASRGFSFMQDGPLDMRMDPGSGESAASWLATADAEAIAKVLREYGEEKFAWRIAKAIVLQRSVTAIETTAQLVKVIESAVPARDQGKHKATRSFQAIRIYINDELQQLNSFLQDCVDLLERGGHLAVISFHSLEDRIVKRFMRSLARGDDLPASVPLRDAQLNRKLKIVSRAQRAGEQEIQRNPRARSAVLRVAEKI
ncbi:MAG: 16S rRNA (cytosine(1402)-N(4))-methyltransferase RsmH [Pseudomonadales bacterium]|nr:16S rRNA (cytosine(1402)-N(4))-methyltransferase RsmH [Gammaproteobacteria bacterium]NNL57059.1 16S rRNA (cytosine(1402)-N(4))-methyltransferase RsmH [Pseudomonadales bacterium]